MALQIDDGKGRGYRAAVTNENLLQTNSVTISLDLHSNLVHQESYSILYAKTPTGAGDCFLYVKNNDDSDLTISTIKFRSASAESVQVKFNDVVTTLVGTTVNTPVNRNARSGHLANITCYDGNDITGLSGGTVVDQLFVGTGNQTTFFSWDSCLILPKSSVLTLYAVTGGVALNMTVSCYFEPPWE